MSDQNDFVFKPIPQDEVAQKALADFDKKIWENYFKFPQESAIAKYHACLIKFPHI